MNIIIIHTNINHRHKCMVDTKTPHTTDEKSAYVCAWPGGTDGRETETKRRSYA